MWEEWVWIPMLKIHNTVSCEICIFLSPYKVNNLIYERREMDAKTYMTVKILTSENPNKGGKKKYKGHNQQSHTYQWKKYSHNPITHKRREKEYSQNARTSCNGTNLLLVSNTKEP